MEITLNGEKKAVKAVNVKELIAELGLAGRVEIGAVPYDEIELSAIKTYEAAARTSKVTTGLEGSALKAGLSMAAFLERLPAVLKADDFKAVARAVAHALGW